MGGFKMLLSGWMNDRKTEFYVVTLSCVDLFPCLEKENIWSMKVETHRMYKCDRSY